VAILSFSIFARREDKLMMKKFIVIILTIVFSMVSYETKALDCPKMPKQVSKDWEVKVAAEVGRIGPVKGVDVKTKTKNATMDLLGTLPDGAKIYLEQMMYSAYCSALRDDNTIKESEKAKLLKEYNREVRKAIGSSSELRSKSRPRSSRESVKGQRQPDGKQTLTKEGESKHSNSSTSEKPKKQVTLKDLYHSDFETIFKINSDYVIEAKNGGNPEELITINAQLYEDFVSQTTFAGFYIPNTPFTYDICKHLADNYKMALDLRKSQQIEFSMPGLQPVNSSELKFSGRIFIYHEYPLLEEQRRTLFSLYQTKNLSPQFRDYKYAADKK
jgi:hypothetical protein